MLTYNLENKTYSKLIPIEELEGMKEKMRAIEERLKNTPINPPYTYETALTLALERVEIDIANLLLDNGTFLYRN